MGNLLNGRSGSKVLLDLFPIGGREELKCRLRVYFCRKKVYVSRMKAYKSLGSESTRRRPFSYSVGRGPTE